MFTAGQDGMRNFEQLFVGALLLVVVWVALAILALIGVLAVYGGWRFGRDFYAALKKARLYRFSVAGLLAVTATFAVFFALLRLAGIDVTHPGIVCVAPFALVLAIGIVALASLVLRDVGESYRRDHVGALRRRFHSDEPPSDDRKPPGADGGQTGEQPAATERESPGPASNGRTS